MESELKFFKTEEREKSSLADLTGKCLLLSSGQNIFRHSTGFSKSLLIKTRNNRIIFVKNINDTEIQKFDLYLQE